nr:MAG TPA: hypothetical protein [Caudoviricetes sp.]
MNNPSHNKSDELTLFCLSFSFNSPLTHFIS